MGHVPRWKDVIIVLQVLSALGISMYAGAYICTVGQEKDETDTWKWVLPHANLCGCHKIVMGGVNTKTPIRLFEPKYVDSPLISEDIGEIREHNKLDCRAFWSGFGEWDSCSTTCGNGSQSREAICVIPEFTRTSCNGTPPIETRKCNNDLCPTWGAWGTWSDCSATCDNGTQHRKKECNMYGHQDAECNGEQPEEYLECNNGKCPTWGEWGDWGDCSKTCDSGTQYRKKECNKSPDHPTAQCNGEQPEESRDCNSDECPTWGSWGNWGECSATCDSGTQYRKKECNNYDHESAQCNGEQPEEYQECNNGECPTWGEWGDWGDCSKTCDSGTQYRKKECNKSPDHPTAQCNGEQPEESRDCNSDECPTWGAWGIWSDCSTTCDEGTQHRKKECNRSPDHPTAQCDGDQPKEYRDCNDGECPTWGAWSNWGGCSATCDSGTQYREKECNRNDHPTAQCNGDQPKEDRECNDGDCPTWGAWGDWSRCSATCNAGDCPTWGGWSDWIVSSATCNNGAQYYREKECNMYGHLSGQCNGEQPKEYMYSKTFDGSIYFLVEDEKTYNEARDACTEHGTTLTSIVSQEEQNFLQSFLEELDLSGQVWIGLNDEQEEGKWTWEDGTQFDYSHWDISKNQPNNKDGNEDCVRLKENRKWADKICSHTFPMYICKIAIAPV